MPLLGTRGAASAKGFGFTVGGVSVPTPWTYTQTNVSVGSSIVNYGKNFGSNSSPKGTLVQYNGVQSNANTIGIFIPQTGYWKPYALSYFVSGVAQPTLTNYGWSNGLYPGNSSGSTTSCFDALLNTTDVQYGSYVGNGTTGRMIPHSLQTWAGVVMCMSDGYYTGGFRLDRIAGNLALFEGNSATTSFFSDTSPSGTAGTISTWSTTSAFRVPDSCNVSGRTYYYIAYANSGTTVYCGTYNNGSTSGIQNFGFEAGTIVTKGSSGGNYAWHNPSPIGTNSNSGDYYYNAFWAEDAGNGQAGSPASWTITSTGFTPPAVGNSWYGSSAGNVYYWAIKKTS